MGGEEICQGDTLPAQAAKWSIRSTGVTSQVKSVTCYLAALADAQFFLLEYCHSSYVRRGLNPQSRPRLDHDEWVAVIQIIKRPSSH